MIPEKVKYKITHKTEDVLAANRFLKRNKVESVVGEHLIMAKQGNKIRGVFSLHPHWREFGSVVVGPLYADSHIVALRLAEVMEDALFKMGIKTYLCYTHSVKFSKILPRLGFVEYAKDNQGHPWFRRDL